MLRPFEADPRARLVAENWPRDVLQDRPSTTPAGARRPRPGQAQPRRPEVPATASPPPQMPDALPRCFDVQLEDVASAHPAFERIRRLALRFLVPPSAHGGVDPSTRIDIESIQEIVSAGARADFDAACARLAQPSVATVSKFLPHCSAADVAMTAAVSRDDAFVHGPLGSAVYLPNTFAARGTSGSPQRSGAMELVLCDVGVGALCAHPSKHVGASPLPPQVALQAAGFDSAAVAMDDTPHIVVFDERLVRPTHIVSVRRVDATAHHAGHSHHAPQPTARENCDLTTGGSPGRASVHDTFREALADAERSVADTSKQLQQLVRRQCADLEEAVRARREWLLAHIRREEAAAQTAIRQRRAAPGLVTAADAHDVRAGRMNSLAGLQLDTSRLLAAVDNLALRQPSVPPPSASGQCFRPVADAPRPETAPAKSEPRASAEAPRPPAWAPAEAPPAGPSAAPSTSSICSTPSKPVPSVALGSRAAAGSAAALRPRPRPGAASTATGRSGAAGSSSARRAIDALPPAARKRMA